MNKSNKLSPEICVWAARLVQEHRGEYPSLWGTVETIAQNISCVPQTLLEWVKRAEVYAGARRPRTPCYVGDSSYCHLALQLVLRKTLIL